MTFSEKIKSVRTYHVMQKDLEKLSLDLKNEIHKLMDVIREGKSITMPRSRPIPSVGVGVHELRLKDSSGQYRFFLLHQIKK